MFEAFASRFTRCANITVLTVGVSLCSLLGGAQSVQAQGLFEALFGRSEPSFSPTLTIPYEPQQRRLRPVAPRRQAFAPRPTKERMAHNRPSTERATPARLHREAQKPEPYKAPEVSPGPLGRFLNDPTLRRGDVVATADGLMVYRGGSSARHRPAEFVAVESAGSLIAERTRQELAKVQVAESQVDPAPATPTRFVESRVPIVAQDDGVRMQ